MQPKILGPCRFERNILTLGPVLSAARDCGWRDTRAAASVEFAIIGFTFVFLLISVFELGSYYLRIAVLDAAVQRASRQIMLMANPTQAGFLALVIADSAGVLSHQTLYIAVQSATTFAAITPVANLSTGGGGTLPYSYGSYGSDVVVQVAYQDNAMGKLLPSSLKNVSSTIAFQNEPANTATN